jgi:membrane associated rhomboid family serine protease
MGGTIIPMSAFLNQMTTIGASGAVYAILLAFGMTFPNEKLFIIPIPVPIKAKWFVLFYAVIELVLAISPNMNDNVAHFAPSGRECCSD